MPSCRVAAALVVALVSAAWWAQPTLQRAAYGEDEAGLEFFEKQVRPLLAARCYECHSGKSVKLQGGLRLDSLAAALQGGDTGPAIMPGNPQESLLVDAINYGELYQMPPKTKLPAEEIAVLTKWVEMGAPWPKEDVATSAGGSKEFDLAQRKAEHWCWQPITKPAVPSIRNPQSTIRNPIDAFILSKLEAKGLSPAPPADERTLIRRAYFDLVGLPPTPEEVEEFLAACSPSLLPSVSPSTVEGEKERKRDRERIAFEAVVDKLLNSPHFGERWGRHWLDLVRYAESRGHEFDPNIPNAFEYRDYVIRALNADVPYDQFVTEHIAGDLLDKPRLHPQEGYNESIIGTGFWFLGEWIHSPVDIRKDECDRIDNMLDVATKTFLGVTVTCARCHDHKFDAISQKDYYALAGYLQSSSYRLTRFESWQQDRRVSADLAALEVKYRPQIAAAVAKAIEPKVDDLAAKLAHDLEKLTGELGVEDVPTSAAEIVVNYAGLATGDWMADGPTFGNGPVLPGKIVLESPYFTPLEVATYGAARRDPFWNSLAPAATSEGDQGRLSGWVRAGRTLKTPTFTVKTGQVHYLIEGAGHVYAAVDSHALLNGPLHGELAKETGGNSDLPARWITHDLSRYIGHRVHLEFSPKGDEDFRVWMVVQGERPAAPAKRPSALLEKLAASSKAGSREAFIAASRELVSSTLALVAADQVAAADKPADHAALANWLIAESGIANSPPKDLATSLASYREERQKLVVSIKPASRLAMTMWQGTPVDENLLIRGNHKTVGPVVPRRMLEAIQGSGVRSQESGSGADFQPALGSGRLELARQIVDPANPLTSRVMVNRVWQHLMGRGIVPSTDNFGVLGQEPTHPELLDHLATQFMQDGWSVKRLIRSIMLSDTYRQGSGGRSQESGADPQNDLFHRQNIKRLEGEAIRDSVLAISGRLDRTQFGPSVPVHLTPFMQGRGRPVASGPLDGNGRRSIYIAVRRNFLSPMMLAFDTPIPFSTVGRRNISNVPAQALILMNDPFVVEQSQVWARKLLADKNLASPEARIRRMYLEAFAREPTEEETAAALAFLQQQGNEYGVSLEAARGDLRVWADLGHVIFNVKGFVFVN